MTFPDSDLPVIVKAAFGADLTADPGTWVFTDLSDRLADEAIDVNAGRQPGVAEPVAGTGSLTLLNDDGALTPLNPFSDYWPDVVLDTPFEVSVTRSSGDVEIMSGFADSWTPELVPTTDGDVVSVVRVTLSGILRRITQGTPPTRSPLRRTISAAGAGAYWPCEDGGDSDSAASAIPNAAPVEVFGAVEFEAVEDLVFSGGGSLQFGTLPLPDLSGGGRLVATIPPDVTATMTSEFSVQIGVRSNSATASGDVVLMEVATPGGTYVRWRLVQLTAIETRLIAITAAGVETVVATDLGIVSSFAGLWISLEQNGGNIDAAYHSAHVTMASGSIAGTLAGPTTVTVNATGVTNTGQFPAGHIAVFPTATPSFVWRTFQTDSYGFSVGGAVNGYVGEAAVDRLARLAAEDGVAITIPAVTGSPSRMGYQPAGQPMELYMQCEAVDQGFLGEAGFGLHFLPRQHRYNLPVSLTVDMSTYRTTAGTSRQVLAPVYDDQGRIDEWQVNRPTGSSAVAGPLTGEPAKRSSSLDANTYQDADLAQLGHWKRGQSTVDAFRWPNAPIDLAANPDMIDDWLTVAPAAGRIVRTGLPAVHFAGDTDEVVMAYSMRIKRRSWVVNYSGVSAAPFNVGVYGSTTGTTTAKYGAKNSTLDAAIGESDTSIAVDSGGDVWATSTTHAALFPAGGGPGVNVVIGGVTYLCTNITGTAPNYTFTIVRLPVDRAHAAGTPVQVANLPKYGL